MSTLARARRTGDALRDGSVRLFLRLTGPVPARYWLLLAIAYVVCYVYWHRYQKPWSGDALYYTAMTYRYAGNDLDDAIRLTGEYFNDPEIGRLRRGFTDPVISPLIYPRVVFPALSVPFVLLMGGHGMYVVPLLASLFIVWGLMRLMTRLFNAEIALAVTFVLIFTVSFNEYLTGLFTESVTVAFVVAILLMLPLGGRTFGVREAIACSVLLVLITFSRQSAPVVVSAICAAWLWTAVRTRRLRGNEWNLPVAVLLPVGIIVSLIQRWWAPYDVVAWYVMVNKEPDTATAFAHFPQIAYRLFMKESVGYFEHDLGIFAIWILGLLAILFRPLSVRTGLLVGALAPSVVLATLNSFPSSFRFYQPMYPFLILSAAGLLHLLLVRPRKDDDEASSERFRNGVASANGAGRGTHRAPIHSGRGVT